MSEAEALARLLDALEAVEFIGRHMHPPALAELSATLGDRDVALREAMADATWPEALRSSIERAAGCALRACDGLRQADDLRQIYRALRQVNRALEALYPLTRILPTVDRFFLTADNSAVGVASADVPAGVLHFGNETSERGGYSVYVPEDYDPTQAYPLVMALHGGAGHGRLFLWSWLREVRGRRVILVAPTATGDTWSLMEPQVDSGHLGRALASVTGGWSIDRSRLLLTGMSDGGTFTLLSGLDEQSPFTHLAPVAASFHPLLLAVTEPRRVMGLPIYLVHGALDWMFPVSMGRAARRALTAAGAALIYREIPDLSHMYPREEGSSILDWFLT